MSDPSRTAVNVVGVVFVSLVLVAGLARDARAQPSPPFDPAIDLQLFEYAIGPKPFLTVDSGGTIAAEQFTVDFLFTALTTPLVVFNVDPSQDEIIDTRTEVVQSMIAGELGGAYGITDRLQIGVSLPIVFSISGEGIDPISAMPSADGLQATGIGDLRAELKARLFGIGGINVAGIGGVTVPTNFGAGGSEFLGDDLPSVRARVAAQWTGAGGRISAGSSVGVIFRKPRELFANTVGQQLTYGVSGAVRVNERVSGVVELFGRAGLPALDSEASPVEAGGGVRIQATQAVTVLAGGGAGLVQGIGSPAARVFLSVGWAPDFGDADGDGLINTRDRCPDLPEDIDGWEDGDGCPDPDNDGDRREDGVDQCPDKREDIDGFQDDDGCPDLDNDSDNTPDIQDKCPVEAEDGIGAFPDDGCPASRTDFDGDEVMDDRDQCPEDAEDMDGFEDEDGCPEADNDNDGIADGDDLCPLCPEDRDGFDDANGCPDPDNDNDGIADASDQCPNEPETLNGTRDEDGCPDAGGDQYARLDGDRIVITGRVRFDRRDRIRRRSRRVLDQVAGLMSQQPGVTQWLIVVAAKKQRTDERTRAKSQRQADAVIEYLASRGVRREVLRGIGAVSDRPKVGIAVREREPVEQTREQLCPVELQVKPRALAPAAAPAPTPAPAAAPAAAAPAAPQPANQPEAAAATPEPRPAPAGNDELVDSLDGPAPAPTPAPAPAPVPEPAPTVPEAFAAYQGVVTSLAFKPGRARVRSRARATLKKIAALMKAHPEVRLEITAHSDHRRGADKARATTQRQADATAKYLVKKGVPRDRITAVGAGADNPIASNDSRDGRAQNRRVELTFSVAP